MSGIIDIAKNISRDFINGIGDLKSQFITIGENIIAGLKIGLGDLKERAKTWFGDLVDGAKETLQIHSPSKVFEGIGEYSGEGVIVGFENMAKYIITAFSDIFDEILNTDISLFISIGEKIGDLGHIQTIYPT